MPLQTFLQTYGYWALLIGTFLEGETILIIGGFAAHRGYLSLTLVILAAFAGTLAGDQFFFFIGRKKGKAFLDKRPSWKPNIEKVHVLLDRYQTLLILGFRFLYGLRTVTPFVIGMSRVKTGNIAENQFNNNQKITGTFHRVRLKVRIAAVSMERICPAGIMLSCCLPVNGTV